MQQKGWTVERVLGSVLVSLGYIDEAKRKLRRKRRRKNAKKRRIKRA